VILLTVGTQLPFDRMVRVVDEWAGNHPSVEIFAQIANGRYLPRNMEYVDYLDEKRYGELFDRAQAVVAHAGMGTVISSLIASKPVIVYPRKASLGEHRNEHQLATCQKLANLKGCYVAYDPEGLHEVLAGLSVLEGGSISPFANDDLLLTVDNFISGSPLRS
jgi:UDP-N-acetylglucosamine transferase subunit ALG13